MHVNFLPVCITSTSMSATSAPIAAAARTKSPCKTPPCDSAHELPSESILSCKEPELSWIAKALEDVEPDAGVGAGPTAPVSFLPTASIPSVPSIMRNNMVAKLQLAPAILEDRLKCLILI